MTVHSDVTAFDVCTKESRNLGSIGYARFALQSCASAKLNVAVTCGGQPDWPHLDFIHRFKEQHNKSRVPQSLHNFRHCSVNRFDGVAFETTDMGGARLAAGAFDRKTEIEFWDPAAYVAPFGN